MTTIRKNGTRTAGEATRFKPGNPGRPLGARNAATVAAEALLDGQAAALTERAIKAALAGDMVAMRLCLDRILAPRRGRPAPIALPAVDTAAGVMRALSAVIDATATGILSPEEAAGYSTLIDAARKGVETVDFEARLARLEEGAHVNRK